MRHKIHRRNCQPEPAITIGSNIYGGRVSTIVVALIVGTLGAFLSFKGYVRRANSHGLTDWSVRFWGGKADMTIALRNVCL